MFYWKAIEQYEQNQTTKPKRFMLLISSYSKQVDKTNNLEINGTNKTRIIEFHIDQINTSRGIFTLSILATRKRRQ